MATGGKKTTATDGTKRDKVKSHKNPFAIPPGSDVRVSSSDSSPLSSPDESPPKHYCYYMNETCHDRNDNIGQALN